MILKIHRKNESGDAEEFDIELSEKLQTALNVQKRFANKPFIKVAKEISSMPIEDLVGFLGCGQKDLKTEEFKELILNNFGLSDLYDAVSGLCLAIQYPGLSEEEISKKVQAQQEKANKMNPGYQESLKQEPLSD